MSTALLPAGHAGGWVGGAWKGLGGVGGFGENHRSSPRMKPRCVAPKRTSTHAHLEFFCRLGFENVLMTL